MITRKFKEIENFYLAFLKSSSIIKSTEGLSTLASLRLFIIEDFNL